MRNTLILLSLAAWTGAAFAMLPPPGPEAKAKADEAAAKSAWQGKVDAFKLCLVQDRVATNYRAHPPAGRPAPGAAESTPACADPGPFVYTAPEAK